MDYLPQNKLFRHDTVLSSKASSLLRSIESIHNHRQQDEDLEKHLEKFRRQVYHYVNMSIQLTGEAHTPMSRGDLNSVMHIEARVFQAMPAVNYSSERR